jgi:uridylate kinase
MSDTEDPASVPDLSEDSSPGGSAKFRRILLKLSGEALMGNLEYGADPDRIRAIAEQVKLVASIPM